jgi:hypothetical protein
MFTSHPSRRRFFEHGIEQSNWTPRAGAVLATAKELAVPTGRITADHILLALECGDHEVSRVLWLLAISPSAALGRPAPGSWSRKMDLYCEDFDSSLRDLPQLVIEEAKAMGDSYLGIEHLLLVLVRVGVPGVDLPYDRIKQTWYQVMGRS